jgi:hypothetical protein
MECPVAPRTLTLIERSCPILVRSEIFALGVIQHSLIQRHATTIGVSSGRACGYARL